MKGSSILAIAVCVFCFFLGYLSYLAVAMIAGFFTSEINSCQETVAICSQADAGR